MIRKCDLSSVWSERTDQGANEATYEVTIWHWFQKHSQKLHCIDNANLKPSLLKVECDSINMQVTEYYAHSFLAYGTGLFSSMCLKHMHRVSP